MEKIFYTYIMASRPYGYLYVGITNNLVRRAYEHQTGSFAGHSQRHEIKTLVYYESHADALTAISREKQLKRFPRQTKFNLINQANPAWSDLSKSLAP